MLSLLLLPALADAAPVKIANVTAKSDYNEGGVNYPISALKDGKSQTPWFEGETGNGLGAWVELDLGGDKNVTSIVMYAGNWASSAEWNRANRPKELKVTWGDGSTEAWTLTDEFAPQTFTPKGGKKTSGKIRFEIKQIYSGSAFPDTGIAEIVVLDDSAPSVTAVTASSEFPRDSSGVYMPTLATDGLRDTFWCEGNKKSSGEAEWVEIKLGGTQPVTGLEICTGMCVSMGVQKKGNAPTDLTVQFSDGSSEKLSVKPFPFAKKIPFASPKSTSSIKIQVDAVQKGSEYDDACLSEVRPY